MSYFSKLGDSVIEDIKVITLSISFAMVWINYFKHFAYHIVAQESEYIIFLS